MDSTRGDVIRFSATIGLTMTALICTILAANTHRASTDIRPGLPFEVHYARLPAFDLQLRAKARPHADSAPALIQQFAQVAATLHATEGQNLGTQRAVMNPTDADLYRQAFAAKQSSNNAKVRVIIGQLQDKSLLGYLNSKPGPASAARPILRGNLGDTGGQRPATIKLPETDDRISLDDRRLGAQLNEFLRQGKSSTAQEFYQRAKKQRTLSPLLTSQAPAAIAAAAFYGGDATPVQNLSEHALTNTPLAAWTAGLQAWRAHAYQTAASRFGMFAANKTLTLNDRAAGYFWQARALQKLGLIDHAHTALQNAADAPRSFYGMLALATLGRSPDLSWSMPELTHEHVQQIDATPEGHRGLALLQIDAPELAVIELQQINVQGNRPLATALLALAHEANLPALALTLGSLVKTVDGGYFDSALYPLPPWQTDSADDRALIYAVMRQESRFNPAAVSPCGASGLMQLMPRTAGAMVTLTQGKSAANLFDPTHNVDLGARYIRHLAKQPSIDNNLLLLIASYNGGPGNAARWAKAPTYHDDPLLFIATLPARETRNYIEKVLSSYWVYQARLGQTQDSLHRLAKGQWPDFVASMPLQEVQTDADPHAQDFIKLASR